MTGDITSTSGEAALTVTGEERALLAQHEPGVNFSFVDAAQAGLSQGRHSRASLLEYVRDEENHRVMWKRMGVGKSLTEREVTAIDARLQRYRTGLISTGWKVPKLLRTHVSELPGEHQVFSYEQFIPGGDGQKLLQDRAQPNFRKWYLIGETLRTLCRYQNEQLRRETIAGQTLTTLPHGLDLEPANLVLEAGSNDLYFVDLFAPKEFDDRGAWLIYSTKLESIAPDALRAATATREGAILRFWRLAEQHWRDGDEAQQPRAEFLARLRHVGLPDEELRFIQCEIEGGYPWLDLVYRERQV